MWAKAWPLGVVLAVQLGLLAVVPARHVRARAWGTPITLKTRPIDPYDLLSGYYVVLRYEVELKASREAGSRRGENERVWIVIRRAEPAWEYVRVAQERPELGEGEIAIPADWAGGELRLVGASRLYVPETQRREAERVGMEAGALVDARVGPDGTIALLRLRAGDRSFGD